MIRRKRASIVRVVLSQALIVLTAWLSLVPVLHGDDTACNPTIVVHDPSQHQITGAGPDGNTPAADDHCLACHLFRNSRSADPGKFVPQGVDAESLVVTVAGELIVTRAAVPLPGRAPPSQI